MQIRKLFLTVLKKRQTWHETKMFLTGPAIKGVIPTKFRRHGRGKTTPNVRGEL